MNREFFAIGMMEYGGLGLLVVLGLFVAALDLARAILLPHANGRRVLHRRSDSRKPCAQSEQSQINQ